MFKIPPFEPGDNLTLNYSWPLLNGLVFASTQADGSSGNVTPVRGSSDVFTAKPLTSGLIHASAAVFGRGRNRTDSTSNFIWDTYARYNFTTADFTCAVYAQFYVGAGVGLTALSNGSNANQWRILVHFDGTAYAANSASFWTYDGTVTHASAASAFDINIPCWLIGVRRGTTHQLWRNSTLLATTVGTARDITGATSGAVQLGNSTSCSQGNHGPALVWNRALTAAEIIQLTEYPTPYSFMSQPSRTYYQLVSGPPAGSSGTVSRGTYGRKGLLNREASHGGF